MADNPIIAFDSYGNLWGTLVMVDQLFAITPEGNFHVVLDDTNEETAKATPNIAEKVA